MASQSQYGQRREQKRWLVTNQNDQHTHRVQVDNDQRLQCYDHAQCWTRQFNNQFNVQFYGQFNDQFNVQLNGKSNDQFDDQHLQCYDHAQRWTRQF